MMFLYLKMSNFLPNPLDQQNRRRSKTMHVKYYIFLIKTNTYFVTIAMLKASLDYSTICYTVVRGH